MKNFVRYSLAALTLAALTQVYSQAADRPAGYVDFGNLAPDPSGGEFVEVNINSSLISMVGRFASKAEPEIAGLLKGLHSIRVNVIGLNNANRDDLVSRIKEIRGKLDTGGWERIVTAQQKKEDVGIYLKTRGEDAVEGIVVTVLDGRKQAVLINIVGDIRPEMLGVIGERFHIDPLKDVSRGLHEKHSEKAEEE
ncbi:MAG: DUF4252 domain-containing protein [Verrucomicrobiia bacterium]